MTILGEYGNVGYGKNILAVRYAKAMAKIGIQRMKLWESLSKTDREKSPIFKGIPPSIVKVLSNFHIEDMSVEPHVPLPNISYMTTDEFLNLQGQEGVQYHLIIDEPYAWGLEARRSGSDIAIEMTKKSLQSRKTGIRSQSGVKSGSDIFYLTQLPSSMDKRLKFLARSVFLALPPDEFGYHYLYMGKLYRVVHVGMAFAKKEIYPYYDTYEKIEVTFSDDELASAGAIEGTVEQGIRQDAELARTGITKVRNDISMITKDGIRIWKSLVKEDIWNEALNEGGKIEQTTGP